MQLYIQDLVSSHNRPVRELKGFYLYLQLSESRMVTFQLGEESLVFTRADGKQGIEPGEYQVWIGPYSTRGLQSGF